MTQLAILFHRFGPYHKARIESVANHLPVSAIEISRHTDVYAWDYVELQASVDRSTLVQTDASNRQVAAEQVRKAVKSCLDLKRPSAVAIPGWSDPAAFHALKWCVLNKTPAILMSESNQFDERRVWYKEWIKKQLARCFSNALVGGQNAKNYLMTLGVYQNRIHLGYDAVDNAHFRRPDELDSTKLREELGLRKPYFLVSARFVSKKNIQTVLHAFSNYIHASKSDSLKAYDLVLMGDGELKNELQRRVEELRLSQSVHFVGFQQYEQIPKYYWGAVALVHASTTEQWGLVVNEAMAAQLPVIVSNRCGCVPELVHDGKNGFTFEPMDAGALADKMFFLTKEPCTADTFGVNSRKIISNWGCDRFATGMQSAFQQAITLPAGVSPTSRILLELLCH